MFESVISSLIGIISVLLVIVVLVVAHELGHFLAAKMCKMRVEEFAVGFGRQKLTLWKSGETEYNIRPIPAGGFVKIAGMDPTEEEVDPNGFNAKSVWARMWVVFAGPLASFLFAYFVFCAMGMTVGLPDGAPKAAVAAVQPDSPGDKAGLLAGDVFVSIDGKPISTGEEMMAAIEANPGREIDFVVLRGGKEITLRATPKPTPAGDKTVGKLGFIPDVEMVRVGLRESVLRGTEMSAKLVKKLFSVIFSRQIATEAGGPIRIAQETYGAAQRGFDSLLLLAAMLSLNFAVLNLLPIPVLDGGHLMLLSVEAIRRRRLSAKTQQTALAVGLATIAVIVVLIVGKDIRDIWFN